MQLLLDFCFFFLLVCTVQIIIRTGMTSRRYKYSGFANLNIMFMFFAYMLFPDCMMLTLKLLTQSTKLRKFVVSIVFLFMSLRF